MPNRLECDDGLKLLLSELPGMLTGAEVPWRRPARNNYKKTDFKPNIEHNSPEMELAIGEPGMLTGAELLASKPDEAIPAEIELSKPCIGSRRAISSVKGES